MFCEFSEPYSPAYSTLPKDPDNSSSTCRLKLVYRARKPQGLIRVKVNNFWVQKEEMAGCSEGPKAKKIDYYFYGDLHGESPSKGPKERYTEPTTIQPCADSQ